MNQPGIDFAGNRSERLPAKRIPTYLKIGYPGSSRKKKIGRGYCDCESGALFVIIPSTYVIAITKEFHPAINVTLRITSSLARRKHGLPDHPWSLSR
jgi:hypothetical protein